MFNLDVKVILKRPPKRPRKSKLTTDPFRKIENRIPLATALNLAFVIRERVRDRAEPVDRAPSYDAQGARVVSPRYIRGTGAKDTKSGAVSYPSSAAMHDVLGARAGSANTSGGGWKGLAALDQGSKRSAIAFTGRSEGQGMALQARGEEPYFDEKGRARPRKVSNALKMGTVLASTGVNVLSPSTEEYRGLSRGILGALVGAIKESMIAETNLDARGSQSALSQAIETLREPRL